MKINERNKNTDTNVTLHSLKGDANVSHFNKNVVGDTSVLAHLILLTN